MFDWNDNSDVARMVGIGALGGGASAVSSAKVLSGWQKFGCIIAGAICAPIFTPLILLFWKGVPPEVLYAASFIVGIGGVVITAVVTAYWERVRRRDVLGKYLDKRLGIPPDDTPQPENKR